MEHAVFTLGIKHWASSQIGTVLLIHSVRYTTEFQAFEEYNFPLPGIVDCLDTIGHIANHHSVMTLAW